MTPEQFEKAMENIKNDVGGDCETNHAMMDELMSKVLRDLGYSKGIDVFEDTPKLYA